MAKGKKLSDKLRLYYRGQVRRPSRVASSEDMQLIKQTLEECLPEKSNSAFLIKWPKEDAITPVRLRIMVGLESALRLLKQKRTLALIYDDRASDHLIKYFIEFANELGAPIIQASKLSDCGNDPKIKRILAISFVDADHTSNLNNTVESKGLQRLVDLLVENRSGDNNKLIYKAPELETIRSSGKSRAKKEVKRQKLSTK